MKTLFIVLAAIVACTSQAESCSLRAIKSIALPHVSGRVDHCALDPKSHRLFVAALGNDTVEVLDISEDKPVRTLSGLHKPQGVAFLSKRDQIVVAGGGDGVVTFFNAASYTAESTVTKLDDADNVRVDADENTVYVGYGDGALAVIDAATGKLTGTIKLDDHPESFQLEKTGPRIFVNVPGAAQIAVVDRVAQKVIATWPLKDFRANFPMALDEANHRLFVGCRHPARMVVLDTESGRRVADVEIAGDTDDLFHDPTRKRIYVSCGAGQLDVISQKTADLYERTDRIATAGGARTAYFSNELAQLYLAVPLRGKQVAEIRIYQPE